MGLARAAFFCLLAWLCVDALAASTEQVAICFNYGCLQQVAVEYGEAQLASLGVLFGGVRSASEERAAIGEAVGMLLGWAGQQSPIGADRGGNYDDDGVNGRMDCIDHSITTTRLLRLMAERGWLRYHRVLRPAMRSRFLFFQHYAAQIREVVPGERENVALRYAVDSWFFDNGHAAAILPLKVWMAGGGPDDEQ